MSCPSRGTWIEINRVRRRHAVYTSCPSRGTWIEIDALQRINNALPESCPSRGTWIEMNLKQVNTHHITRRAPRGARGLKWFSVDNSPLWFVSCPSRGTWIEISAQCTAIQSIWSCPSRGTWIEMAAAALLAAFVASCPSRGTWIEIRETPRYINRGVCRAPRGARGLKLQKTRLAP